MPTRHAEFRDFLAGLRAAWRTQLPGVRPIEAVPSDLDLPKVSTFPKAEPDKQEAAYQRDRKKNPKRGPKPS